MSTDPDEALGNVNKALLALAAANRGKKRAPMQPQDPRAAANEAVAAYAQALTSHGQRPPAGFADSLAMDWPDITPTTLAAIRAAGQ